MPASLQRKVRRAQERHAYFLSTYLPIRWSDASSTQVGELDPWFLDPSNEPVVVCMRMRLCGLDVKCRSLYESWKKIHELQAKIQAYATTSKPRRSRLGPGTSRYPR